MTNFRSDMCFRFYCCCLLVKYWTQNVDLMDSELIKNVDKRVISHVFYSLLSVKPKKSHVYSIHFQETKFHSLIAKRMRFSN